ncbi:GGDEF domain-containing protein [Aliidiomarina quisquiliarum]|uniref:tetratricopeptide repeat-containing diguanylate cyclase n=1 Tax=Aliidiomarina quisquiliarum TaxID=2938947 RepID=UPI00208F433B|nr:GGDEF domain-containing protein [Aliidiomarina quisquiliarum]MCO4321133.1 diguanylate cyclase [Aliidiomarina quisquiliarum]
MCTFKLWQKLIPILLFIISTNAYAVSASDVSLHENADIEAQLDQYLLRFSRGESKLSELEQIVSQVTPNTPILTQTRARGYYILTSINPENLDESWRLAMEILKVAEASGVIDAIVDARTVLVSLHYYGGNTEDALVELEQMQRYLDHVASPRVRYFAHNLAGRLLRSVGDFEKALAHFLLAANAVRETDDVLTLRRRLFITEGIARVQASLRHYDVALNYANQLIDTAEAEGLENELARLYLFRGYLESMLDQRENSIHSHELAITWGRQFGADEVVLLSMNNIGSSLMEVERYEEAQSILQEALLEAQRQNDERTIHLLNFNLSYIDVMLGNVGQGIAGIEDAAKLIRADVADAEYVDVLKYLADAYTKAGMLERTIEVLKEQRAMQQALAVKERDKALAELQTRYRANEQAAEIELLEQRNQVQEGDLVNARLQQRIFILLSIVIVLASILLFLAWRTARQANLRLKSVNLELEYQSTHDPLTGLLNRRSFQAAMNNHQRQSDARIEGRHPDALLLLDIDYFKKINDRSGHAAGDKVLVEIARRLNKVTRNTDMVVRWGGEEFLIYLREMDPGHLAEFTERALHILGSTPVKCGHRDLVVTATAGFITLPFSGLNEEELGWERCLQIADMALYIGKVQGRNQGLGVMELMVDFEQAQEALENDLTGAIEKGWVRVVHIAGPNV